MLFRSGPPSSSISGRSGLGVRDSRESTEEPETRLCCGCAWASGGEADRDDEPETVRVEALLARPAALADDAGRVRGKPAETESATETRDEADAVRV